MISLFSLKIIFKHSYFSIRTDFCTSNKKSGGGGDRGGYGGGRGGGGGGHSQR